MGQIKNITLHIVTDIKEKHSIQSSKNGPNHSGYGTCEGVREGFVPTGEEMHETRPQGIPEDCHGNSYWFCHHGIHWIFRQTHPHPNQQHHRSVDDVIITSSWD